MASSADVPHCTRTSFLMSNYHRWTGHISLVLLSNTSRRYLPYCSVLSKVSMLIYMKTPGKLKRFWVSHLTHLQILNIFGKSTGDIDRENRGGKQALGKMFFPFTSLPERWFGGCLLLPTDWPNPSKVSPLRLASALSHLSARQVSSKAAQENKSEWATFMLTFHLQRWSSLSLLFKVSDRLLSNNLNLANYTETSPNHSFCISNSFSSVQLLSRVQLFATPWIAACQNSLSITNSRSSLKLTSIESVMPSSHLTLCRPLLLLPPIPPSIRVFSNESTLRMRWPKDWSFSFSIIPSKEQPGLISFQSKGLSRVFSNTTVQEHQFFSAQLSLQSISHIHTWPLEKP